ncbi:hypothetical protein CBL_03062 [Carabus blaptoides fortunei]
MVTFVQQEAYGESFQGHRGSFSEVRRVSLAVCYACRALGNPAHWLILLTGWLDGMKRLYGGVTQGCMDATCCCRGDQYLAWSSGWLLHKSVTMVTSSLAVRDSVPPVRVAETTPQSTTTPHPWRGR